MAARSLEAVRRRKYPKTGIASSKEGTVRLSSVSLATIATAAGNAKNTENRTRYSLSAATEMSAGSERSVRQDSRWGERNENQQKARSPGSFFEIPGLLLLLLTYNENVSVKGMR